MKRHLGLLRLLPLTAVFMLLAGCGEERLSALDPYGPQAEWILDNMILSLYVMALVVIVVFALYFIAVVKFRKKPGDEELPEQVEGSKALELTWTIIPVFLLAILAVPTIWGTYYMAEEVPEAAGSSGGESENGEQSGEGGDSQNSGSSSEQQQGQDALVIDVTAHQFWWQFDYPEGFSAGNEVYIPTNEKVWFNLTSSDVIHSFWVPALGGKIDTIPGVENTMWLEANEPGVYKGKCAELCGPSHALMDFKVIAMEPGQYEAWEAEMASGSASSGNGGSGESGSEQETSDNSSGEGVSTVSDGRQAFEDQGCITCHAVEGQGTGQGPTLSNFGDREKIANILEPTDENLEEWIRHPGDIKQGNNMPGFPDMNDEDMNAIIQYLQSLSAKENMNQ
ncbi:cytochrome c oxidase subunit II [Salibacterium halotolerans]|uniref:Cytochrome c oxidase subunit 2 n=1 Tax=Salibacterium halotolerans TaxID=1884432 RepID=A0A1I5M1K3_9BACI|nr:cytochrome c oxidase subunit II [Salibacterium halotolerans]SFP03370.1 cytochrome c oxidase subunit 2 [Salibacterium halotolerans]